MKKNDKFSNKIKLDYKNILLIDIVFILVFLLFGLYLYVSTFVASSLVSILFGVYLILKGLFLGYQYLMREACPLFNNRIIGLIVSLLLGLFVMINPFKIIKILTFTLGLYLIMWANLKILDTIKLKQYKYDGYLIMLVSSIIMFIFGIFILINPMNNVDIVKSLSIFIILYSVLEISNLFMFYNKCEDLLKLFKKKNKQKKNKKSSK